MLLVLGKSGQLAQELARLNIAGAMFAGRESIDQSRPETVEAAIREMAPTAVINAAAYTAVDKAETQQDEAFAINAHAAHAASRACAHLDIPFVHVSTDYVFAGTGNQPYKEDAVIAPLNAYGASKAQGEGLIHEVGGKHAIIRTSWVYSQFGANFVKTMRRLANERDSVSVVADQLGRPTYGADLAQACLFMVDSLKANPKATGVYHYANEGAISWADLAGEVFALNEAVTGKKTELVRISSQAFPTPAKRPSWSVFDTTKIEDMGLKIGNWKDRLAVCFAELS
jgi:dTDP-4-dehydrorhamnose reductase